MKEMTMYAVTDTATGKQMVSFWEEPMVYTTLKRAEYEAKKAKVPTTIKQLECLGVE